MKQISLVKHDANNLNKTNHYILSEDKHTQQERITQILLGLALLEVGLGLYIPPIETNENEQKEKENQETNENEITEQKEEKIVGEYDHYSTTCLDCYANYALDYLVEAKENPGLILDSLRISVKLGSKNALDLGQRVIEEKQCKGRNTVSFYVKKRCYD